MQARLKRNYDGRLRRESERIKSEDYVYVRAEIGLEKEHRRKLAAVAEGPYRVIETKDNAVAIEKEKKSADSIFRSCIVQSQACKH